MPVTHGMNPDEVEALGRVLRQKAEQLRQLTSSLDRRVATTTWTGPAARQFLHGSWPRHRTRLHDISQRIHGFGESAISNAAEQRRVSATGGAPGAIAHERLLASIGLAPPTGISAVAIGATRSAGFDSASVRTAMATLVGLAAGEKTTIAKFEEEHFRGITRSRSSTYDSELIDAGADGELSAGATARREGELTVEGSTVSVSGGVGASAGAAAKGRAYVEAGAASAEVSGEAFAGAEAEASGTASVGLTGVAVAGGVSAFAGARAGAQASGEVFGGTGTVGGEVYAGLGGHAEIEAAVSYEEITLGIDLGLAIGIGAGVEVELSFSPREATEDVLETIGFPW